MELGPYLLLTVTQILSTKDDDKSLSVLPTLDQSLWSDFQVRQFQWFYTSLPDLEPNVFDGKTVQTTRKRHYPLAKVNEFFIEKSTQYAKGHIHEILNRANSMYEVNPEMKLFAFLTGTFL